MAPFLKKILFFLVYTNLFIAACALALTYETFVLLQLPDSINWYLFLLFLCTLFVYSLHYFVKTKKAASDSRLLWCRRNKRLLFLTIITSALLIAGGVIVHFNAIFKIDDRLNYPNIVWFFLVPLVALGYSHPLTPWNKKGLRQTGWFKLLSLSLTWSFTTTLLPVLMLLPDFSESFSKPQLIILFLHRFVFIASLSVLFNVNDYEEDKADGVKTIAVLLGPERTLRQGKRLTLLLNLAMAILLLYTFPLRHMSFYIAILIPAGLLYYFYDRFIPAKEEAFFVLRHDGLMIVKALLLIFALLIFSI